MAENTVGPPREQAQHADDQSSAATVENTPEQSEAPAGKSAPAPATRSGSRIGLWLLLILLAALPLTWFLVPEDTRQGWLNILKGRISHQETVTINVSPSPEPAPKPESGPAPPEPEQPVASRTAESVQAGSLHRQTATPALSSHEARALMAAMDDLRKQTEALQHEQAGLLRQLRVRQQIELRARLRRITGQDGLFVQMAGNWRDIALLPILTEDERATAEEMQKLAAVDAEKTRRWRRQLKKLAATLAMPEHPDVLPRPDNAFFAWLTGQFHLRRMPQPEQQAQAALHDRLVGAAQALAVGVWPQKKAWRHLLADLRKHFGDETELGLPEQLEGIREDMVTMHKTAADWLNRL